jgi:hypothetical protein
MFFDENGRFLVVVPETPVRHGSIRKGVFLNMIEINGNSSMDIAWNAFDSISLSVLAKVVNGSH